MAVRSLGRAGAAALAALVFSATTAPLGAQATGALSGRIRDAVSGRGVASAVVTLGDGRRGAVTDTAGEYRVREVRSGVYDVRIRAIGYGPVTRTGMIIRGGETSTLSVSLQPRAEELSPVVTEVVTDPVLDPLATRTEQTITAEDLHKLPVSSLDEALALSAGAVGESYRGGRLGQQSFILDGLGVKNQLDASTGSLGLRFPPDMLTEASLVTNGFSARYGQAVSGLVNVITKDGGRRWSGRAAYETDRPMGRGADLGLDRAIVEVDGPLVGGATVLLVVDAAGRLDADPVGAPAPVGALDPRSTAPGILPHNGGQTIDAAAKVTIPFGQETLRIFGLRSTESRLLYDPAYKYDEDFAPGRHITGTLLSAHLEHASGPAAHTPIVADLRVGYFLRDFVRGTPTAEPDRFFGAFSSRPVHIVDEELARGQDTAAARGALPGFFPPGFSTATPYGVPAFFLGGGSRGALAFNRFRELRSQLDVTIGTGRTTDLYVGGSATRQQVRTFQRALSFLPTGDSVPPPTASTFSPLALAAYVEGQLRVADLAFTGGVRYDRFDARLDLAGAVSRPQAHLNPRFGVSTVLKGATVVISGGSFSQPPDYQYLVDAAFDDTTRTGRFRQGNPDLGFERSWQYELSVRGRVRPGISLRVGTYLKRLEGLVASVPLGTSPDSTVFGNQDAGTVRGLEVRLEREIRHGWGLRLSYTLQDAKATSTSAFLLRRLIRVDPMTHDTIIPAKVEFPLDYDRRHGVTLILQGQIGEKGGPALLGVRPLAGLELAAIGRVGSGLPYTRFVTGTDTLNATPNGARLPASATLDVLLRRPVRIGRLKGSFYLDVRNLLNRQNLASVRRDTGLPTADIATVNAMALAAYDAHPEPIPYESARYRGYADLDRNGLIEGRAELLPMYQAAAQDFLQPLFAYAAPRLWRFGLEILF